MAYYGLAMDLQKFGLSVYLVQVLFGVIDIPAMLVATATMIYVGRRATVASFLILAGLMVIANMLVPEGEPPASAITAWGLWGVGSGGQQIQQGDKAETFSRIWKESNCQLAGFFFLLFPFPSPPPTPPSRIPTPFSAGFLLSSLCPVASWL